MLFLIITYFFQNKKYLFKICFSLAERGSFMSFTKKSYGLPEKRNKQIQNVIDTLRMGGRSENTIENYVGAISRFLKYYKNKDISKFDEENITEYIKKKYLISNCSVDTYNMNISAIKYFYIINFKKEFNNKLLPRAKRSKKIPATVDKKTFIKILNEETYLKHKCWLLLAYCSGLRAEEVANVKITDIHSDDHELKVLGKRKKERYTVLPDITIECLRQYYKQKYCQKYHMRKNLTGYLFEGSQGADHINVETIVNYFTSIKKKYKLDKNITYHSLRHSFASNFIKAGGDPFVLKSMMGHTSMSTTSIYIHMGRDFNNLKGVNYDGI